MNILRKAAANSFQGSHRLNKFQNTFFNINKRLFSEKTEFETILVSRKEEKIELIQLNRPKALNALCDQLFNELLQAVQNADKDPNVSCIVLTGSDKAFAAGADIKEMKDKQFSEAYSMDMLGWWD